MGYKNNNYSYDRDRNYGSNGRNDRDYSASGNRYGNSNSGRSSSAPKKHSGCRVTVASKGSYVGSTVVTGWNYSRRHGLVTFLATPYSKSHESTSKNGRKWVNYMVTVTPKMSKSFIVSGMMDSVTKMVTIEELGFVMNPKAKNGGYCGRYGGK